MQSEQMLWANYKKDNFKQIHFYMLRLSKVKIPVDRPSQRGYTIAEMANTKSAIKRIRRIKRQTEVNKTRKSRYKIALKKMKKLIDSKKKNEALSYLPKLNSELMKIAKTGVIKKGNAIRNVSKITRKINSL